MKGQSENKVEVAILHPIDPFGIKIGGISTFIKTFIKYAPEDFKVNVVGVDASGEGGSLGTWNDVSLQGRPFRFFPVMKVEDENMRTKVPLVFKFTLSLARHLPLLVLRDGIVELHRVEPSFLPLGRPGRRVLFVHGHMGDLFNVHSEIKWSKAPYLYFQFERGLMGQFSRVYVVRRDGVEFYRDKYPFMADRFHFLPTWVDEETFYPYDTDTRKAKRKEFIEEQGYNPGDKLILFVGRLEGQKDPLLLIDSFHHLHRLEERIRLLVVGTGLLSEKVRRRVEEYGLSDRVKFISPLPQLRLAHLMRISHVLLLTSAFEGMPRSVLEALACGLPVVTTDVGEVRRVVRDGFSGLVCQGRSPEAIARALSDVLRGGIRAEDCVSSIRDYEARKVLEGVYNFYRRLGGEI